MNWNVLDTYIRGLLNKPSSSKALCHIAPTNVRRLFCIISSQSRCIAIASSHMSISVLKISDLVMLYNHSNTRLMFLFHQSHIQKRWDIIRWQVKLSLFATYIDTWIASKIPFEWTSVMLCRVPVKVLNARVLIHASHNKLENNPLNSIDAFI